ncbi:hypothetical protein V1477_005683 [Vespula maculifrons]|uniref:Uncharacterized protein n=1 Tax=Vespula maculifrons TaxID=7453 RepID=A0ABD2CLY7_VESMC
MRSLEKCGQFPSLCLCGVCIIGYTISEYDIYNLTLKSDYLFYNFEDQITINMVILLENSIIMNNVMEYCRTRYDIK